MNIRSAKAKGRRAAQEVAELLLKYAPGLTIDDVQVTPSSVTGEDIKLSAAARDEYPFVIEVKNQEKIQIWDAYEQALCHLSKRKTLDPDGKLKAIVFFRRNHSKLMACMEAEDLMKLMSVINEIKHIRSKI